MSRADTLDLATAIAAAKGLVVVQPKPNELFVDIDDAASLAIFEAHVAILKEHIHCTWLVMQSPSGKPGRFHATVTLMRDVTPLERIALQAILGSDRLHELLSWRALDIGNETPTLFFEKRETAERTEELKARLAKANEVAALPLYEP